MLKSEIKKLDIYSTGVRFRTSLLCFAPRMIAARNLAEFL
ncbi:hypothetical protein UNSW1_51 [Campylobacter concisus UNSW1]|nr:hypothetical protein UNSW1_51 [Campylobacter concisus UNSW1]